MYVHFIFSCLLLKDWKVSIIIFINIKFRITKIILLKCRPHQAKKSVSLTIINNWKKEFPWLIVELENNLPSGLFRKVCLKYEDKLKVFEGMMANLFPKVQKHSSPTRNFIKLTWKHLRQSLFFNKLQAWDRDRFIQTETLAQPFSCEFCEISKSTSFYGTPLVAASEGKVIS